MSVILKTRKHTRAAAPVMAGPVLDAAILAVIRKRGPQLGIELLGEVEVSPREMVDRLQRLVSTDVLRHGPDRRFSLRVAS